jgi:hypothetical protein
LALFAASNDGAEGYYSIGSPAVSKNALTVGATRSSSASEINSVAFFSSIGPTYDNRIKPDVVAPGFYTISAKAAASTTAETCDVVSMAGTSMATPAVCISSPLSSLDLLYRLLEPLLKSEAISRTVNPSTVVISPEQLQMRIALLSPT